MFHLYLVTAAEGSWPLLCDEALAEAALPTGTAVVALLGRFERRESASAALAREAIYTLDRQPGPTGDPASSWPRTPVSEPGLPSPRKGRRRSGRRWIPG